MPDYIHTYEAAPRMSLEEINAVLWEQGFEIFDRGGKSLGRKADQRND